jgi:hypothetical protein
LLGALLGGRHQQYVESAETLDRPSTMADGNAILGHLLGSKDVSRQVASRASGQTGLGTDLLKRRLPEVAAMAVGALTTHADASLAESDKNKLQDVTLKKNDLSLIVGVVFKF